MAQEQPAESRIPNVQKKMALKCGLESTAWHKCGRPRTAKLGRNFVLWRELLLPPCHDTPAAFHTLQIAIEIERLEDNLEDWVEDYLIPGYLKDGLGGHIHIDKELYLQRKHIPLVKEVRRRKASTMAELMIEGNMASTQVGAIDIFKNVHNSILIRTLCLGI